MIDRMNLTASKNISSAKSEFRQKGLKIRGALEISYRESAQAQINDSLWRIDEISGANTILMFYPIKSEIDLLPFAKKALEKGKCVAFARVEKSENAMYFHSVSSLCELSEGAFSIPEPKRDAPLIDPKNPEIKAVCILPGVAFDRSGFRIGYGKGFYDRFLDAFGVFSVAPTFSRLLFDAVPHDSFDKQADVILTESETIYCKVV